MKTFIEIRDKLRHLRRTSVAYEWIESILIAVLLAFFIKTFFIQAFKIPTGSMRMTLLEGDRILVNKLRYGAAIPFSNKRLPGYSAPKRGDIIVFKYPEDPKRDFIKRLIAVGGETVEIREGDIYINSKLIQQEPLNSLYYYNRGDFGQRNQPITVPPNSYFVLGDNSASSQDSRYWGFVPESMVVGRAELIFWPLTRIRAIK